MRGQEEARKRGQLPGKGSRRAEKEAEGRGRNSLGSKEEDRGADRLQNDVAPMAVILLEQHLCAGNFPYRLYLAS